MKQSVPVRLAAEKLMSWSAAGHAGKRDSYEASGVFVRGLAVVVAVLRGRGTATQPDQMEAADPGRRRPYGFRNGDHRHHSPEGGYHGHVPRKPQVPRLS